MRTYSPVEAHIRRRDLGFPQSPRLPHLQWSSLTSSFLLPITGRKCRLGCYIYVSGSGSTNQYHLNNFDPTPGDTSCHGTLVFNMSINCASRTGQSPYSPGGCRRGHRTGTACSFSCFYIPVSLHIEARWNFSITELLFYLSYREQPGKVYRTHLRGGNSEAGSLSIEIGRAHV